MSATYDFVTGDTGSTLQVTCKDRDSGAIIDLTGATVRLRWKDAADVTVTKVMTVTAPLTGVAKYTFGTGELIAPRMRMEVEITDSSAKVITTLSTIDVLVREQIG